MTPKKREIIIHKGVRRKRKRKYPTQLTQKLFKGLPVEEQQNLDKLMERLKDK